jgi:hypothetical protein
MKNSIRKWVNEKAKLYKYSCIKNFLCDEQDVYALSIFHLNINDKVYRTEAILSTRNMVVSTIDVDEDYHYHPYCSIRSDYNSILEKNVYKYMWKDYKIKLMYYDMMGGRFVHYANGTSRFDLVDNYFELLMDTYDLNYIMTNGELKREV